VTVTAGIADISRGNWVVLPVSAIAGIFLACCISQYGDDSSTRACTSFGVFGESGSAVARTGSKFSQSPGSNPLQFSNTSAVKSGDSRVKSVTDGGDFIPLCDTAVCSAMSTVRCGEDVVGVLLFVNITLSDLSDASRLLGRRFDSRSRRCTVLDLEMEAPFRGPEEKGCAEGNVGVGRVSMDPVKSKGPISDALDFRLDRLL